MQARDKEPSGEPSPPKANPDSLEVEPERRNAQNTLAWGHCLKDQDCPRSTAVSWRCVPVMRDDKKNEAKPNGPRVMASLWDFPKNR
jgi:hypothetical protein